jgi:hypothetical protein
MLGKAIKRGLMLAVVVPLAAAGVRRLSQAVESRRGPSKGTALLRHAADALHRNSKRGRRW